MNNLAKLKSIPDFLLITAAAIIISSCQPDNRNGAAEAEGFCFGTFISVKSFTDDNNSDAEKMSENAVQICERLDSVFSRSYTENANRLIDQDGCLKECLTTTASLNDKYGDGVNLTCGRITSLWGISSPKPAVPESDDIIKALGFIEDTGYHNGDLKDFSDGVMLDFGAVAKGYACDLIYRGITEDLYTGSEASLAGKNSCQIVSMGSTTLLCGEKPDKSSFKVAVKDPASPGGDNYLGIISCAQAFISTSGGYERFFVEDGIKYEHIIDVKTGYPIKTDLTSVTVIVPVRAENGGILSDFLSTLIYIGGTESLDRYLGDTEYYVIAADINGFIHKSRNMPEDMFSLKNEVYSYAQ